MARIRSIHPGIYTDEAWASVSVAARWLGMGICTEADDNGTFEWKPLQLKMRVFPVDNVNVADLLDELEAAGVVMRFAAEGRALGSLKNFCRFQRPRKPKAWFPTTDQSRQFAAVGAPPAADDDNEPPAVPQKSELATPEAPPVPPKSAKRPQMEDGGGRREEKISDANASSVANGDGESGFEDLWKAYPHVRGRSSKPKALVAYRALSGDQRVGLSEAAKRYAGGGTLPQSGAPALSKWLDDELWSDWTAAEPEPLCLWQGPADVRAAFVSAPGLGESWCRSYLDQCGWRDVPERTLIPATTRSLAKLTSDGRATLTKLGLTVMERAA